MMMISPDDLLHSRSIVEDLALQDGEKKETPRSETFIDTANKGTQKKKSNKTSKQPDPKLKYLSSSPGATAGDNKEIAQCPQGHSSSSSSLSSASLSSSLSVNEGKKEGMQNASTFVNIASDSLVSNRGAKRSPTSPATEPKPADILLGRGKPFQSHQGNQFMLHAVDQLRDDYLNTDRKGKHTIIEHVLGLIRARGGRFIIRADENEDHSPWMEVKRSISYRKVGHAFRSKARRLPASPEAVVRTTNTTHDQSSPPMKISVADIGVPPFAGRPSMAESQPSTLSPLMETKEQSVHMQANNNSSRGDSDVVGIAHLSNPARGYNDKTRLPAVAQAQQTSSVTGIDMSVKELLERGHRRIAATNPLLGLPEFLPPVPAANELPHNEVDSRLVAAWLLRQQQQQQQLTLNDIVAMEQRLEAHQDAFLALRGRQQQTLGLLSQHQQGRQGASFLLQQGDGVRNNPPLVYPSRLSHPTTRSPFPAAAVGTSFVGTSASDFVLSRSSVHSAPSLPVDSFGRVSNSNFLLDPSTPAAVELFIFDHQRRRSLMQQEVLAGRQWATIAAAAYEQQLRAAVGVSPEQRNNQRVDSPTKDDRTGSSPSTKRRRA